MASRAGGLIEDQNVKVHSNGDSVLGKGVAFKTQRKGELGGRKPLGDVSNLGKPALSQASKRQASKNVAIGTSIVGKGDVFKTQVKGLGGVRKPLCDLSNSGKPASHHTPKKQHLKFISSVEEVTSIRKIIIHDASTKKAVSKASDKMQTRSRKALSDISNSEKPHLQKQHSTALKVAAEEPLCPSAIAEEGFLHNHQECIKAQNEAMDTDQFLMTTVSGFKPKSPMKCNDLEENSGKLNSPPPVFESPKYLTPCEDFDILSGNLDYPPNHYTDSPWVSEDSDFKLIETSESPNHRFC